MSGMEPILIGAAVAGTAASAGGSIMRGREESIAAQFEQQQLQIQEQNNRTAALQAEAERRREFTSSMETIAAIRAGRGVGSSSPTADAIYAGATEDAERDIRIERLNYLQKADLARRSAVMAGRKAKTSLLAGYLGAASTIGESAGRFARVGR